MSLGFRFLHISANCKYCHHSQGHRQSSSRYVRLRFRFLNTHIICNYIFSYANWTVVVEELRSITVQAGDDYFTLTVPSNVTISNITHKCCKRLAKKIKKLITSFTNRAVSGFPWIMTTSYTAF